MNFSATAKVVLTLALATGIALFAIVVDMGISAGRIHHGVCVGDVDVGGLTPIEAVAELEPRGELLQTTPVRLFRDGVRVSFVPGRLAWNPDRDATVAEAMEVGRGDAPFGALADRVRAWLEGVEVGWQGSPDAAKVGRLLNRLEERLAKQGLVLDRPKMRFKIRRGINTWPRDALRIPLLESP